MKKKQLYLVAVALLCAMAVKAQVGINTVTPDKSAALDIYYKAGASDTPKGFLPPKMTTSERGQIIEPAKGLIIYNTTVDSLQYNFGTPVNPKWVNAGGGGPASAPANKATDWFYMPVTVLSTSTTTPQTLDLYADYKAQFDMANAGGASNLKVYERNELEFYLIGYDKLAFPTISLTTQGMLYYTPDPTKVTKKSYVNVIIKIK